MTTATYPGDFAAVLRGIAATPTADAYFVGADWADEHDLPTPPVADAGSSRMPGWFTKSWRRVVPEPVRGGRFVDQEIQNFANAGMGTVIDHWGAVHLFGVAALVSEPYDIDTPKQLTRHLRRINEIARRCGGVAFYSRRATWPNPWVRRILWLPHPDRLAAALAGRGNAFYCR